MSPQGSTPQGAQPVLLYDGHCAFCVREANRVARWVGGRVRLESFREPGVMVRYGLTAEQCEQGLQLIGPDGRISSGLEGIARAFRLSPLLAPLGRLYYVPGLRQLGDAAYRLVARNRFRLGGRVCTDETCRLHQQPRE